MRAFVAIQLLLLAAGTIVQYFRNASATEPAQLMCASLANDDDKVLNVMLPTG